MLKKILTLILGISIFASVLIPCQGFALSDESDVPSCEAAIASLKRFKMIPEDFDADKIMTFGEFVGLAMKLTGLDSVPVSEGQYFSDVPKSAKHYNAVMHAKNMGIATGLGNGTLGYNQSLTMDRAAKILVAILGYEPYAQSKGGWSAGYIIVAGQEGILDGCAFDSSKPLTGRNAAQMVYNCLEIDILVQESYPEGNYKSYDGENPLTQWMKIQKTEGVVTGNQITTTSGGEGLDNGIVTIDNERYVENGTLAGDLLGCKVTAYYKEENGKKVLLEVSLDDEAKIYEIPGTDIANETTKEKVHYYTDDSEKVQSVSVSPDAYIFYNFKKYNDAPSDVLFNPETGALKLIDYDGDKKADVVYITDSEIYVVESITAGSGKVYDKYGKPDIFLADDEDKGLVVDIILDGAKVDVTKVMANNVLTVTRSDDGKYIRAEVGYRKVKGTLSEKGNGYIVAKNKKYNIHPQCEAVFEGINPGTNGIVLLDIYYNAAGFIADSSSDGTYGYAISAMTKKSGLAGDKTAFKIYTTDGNVEIYELSKDIKINGKVSNDYGEKYDDSQTVIDEFTADVTYYKGKANERTFPGVFDHQLIKYKLDAKGKLSSIEKAVLNCRDFGGTGKAMDAFSLDLNYRGYGNADTPVRHNFIYKNSGLLGNDFNLKEAQGIQIPSPDVWIDFYDGNITESDLESMFSLYQPYLDWSNDTTFDKGQIIKLYDIDDMKMASVIITEGAKLSVNVGPYFMLVEGISEVLDKDGMPGTAITGMYRGKYQKIFVDTTADAFTPGKWKEEGLLDLKPGDVIRIALNSTGEIVNLFKVYTVKQESEWTLGRDTDKRNISVMTTFRDKTSPAYREYLLGGNEFSEIIFSNGESGDPYSVRIMPYCYWTGFGLIAVHARSAYMKQGQMIVSPGIPYGETDPVGEKIGFFPGNSDNGGNVRGSYYFDESTGIVREATADDLEESDYKSYVMRIRYGLVEDLIIINHKEPIQGDWYGWSETK